LITILVTISNHIIW